MIAGPWRLANELYALGSCLGRARVRGAKDGILERAGRFFVVSLLLFFLFSPLFRLSVTTSTRFLVFLIIEVRETALRYQSSIGREAGL